MSDTGPLRSGHVTWSSLQFYNEYNLVTLSVVWVQASVTLQVNRPGEQFVISLTSPSDPIVKLQRNDQGRKGLSKMTKIELLINDTTSGEMAAITEKRVEWFHFQKCNWIIHQLRHPELLVFAKIQIIELKRRKKTKWSQHRKSVRKKLYIFR